MPYPYLFGDNNKSDPKTDLLKHYNLVLSIVKQTCHHHPTPENKQASERLGALGDDLSNAFSKEYSHSVEPGFTP